MIPHQPNGPQLPPAPPSLDAETLHTWPTPNGRGLLAGCPFCTALSHHRLNHTDRAVRRGRCGHHYVVSTS